MADNKLPRRPVAGSRTPSRSPRRLAGQAIRPGAPADEPTDAQDPDLDPDDVDHLDDLSEDGPEAPTPAPVADGLLQRTRTTRILAVLVAVVAVVLGALIVLQFQDEPDPGRADVTIWDPVTRAGEFTLPQAGELPVVIDPLDWTASVDEIAHNVTKVLSFNYETIDTQEELAADLVTEDFLVNDLRQTIAETAPKLKENKAEYVVTVAGQSVISATPTEVRALLFVNQLVTKGTGKNAVSDNYPLRLDVVGEKVGDTWRISSLNAG